MLQHLTLLVDKEICEFRSKGQINQGFQFLHLDGGFGDREIFRCFDCLLETWLNEGKSDIFNDGLREVSME